MMSNSSSDSGISPISSIIRFSVSLVTAMVLLPGPLGTLPSYASAASTAGGADRPCPALRS